MRIARFTHNDVPQYAFVQTDKNDGKDYLVALNGYPLSGQAVEPTGERYPVDGDGIRLLAPVIPSKVYGWRRIMRRMRGSCMRPVIPISSMRRRIW